MAFQIPSTLKAIQLRVLALKCGISTTGTKPVLVSRLHDEINRVHKPTTEPVRVLSIDMGIRNMAYCFLDIPITRISHPRQEQEQAKKILPSIYAWHRLAVSTAPVKSTEEGVKTPKEAFDPSTLSKTAYTLLRHRLLIENPTHILIERQRFRSMGSKHILEWTIRVNMFETILYAILCTLKQEGVWNGEIKAIAPGKVGPFWVGEDLVTDDTDAINEITGKIRKSQSAKVRNKGLKIDLVRKWLESGEMVTPGNEATTLMAKAYIEKWDRLPGRPEGGRLVEEEGEVRMGKLDDLADCLLQGMAWRQWEDNKRIAMKYGVEALLEMES